MIIHIQNTYIKLVSICDLITAKFNCEIIFTDKDKENADYYIQYNDTELNNKKCLNIIDSENNDNYSSNILNLYDYCYILECELENIDNNYTNLVYLTYVIYNFIVINTNFVTNKPIVLDPISTIKTLINNKCSNVRFGDGEINILDDIKFSEWNYASKINDTSFIKNTLTSLINYDSTKLQLGICDVFEKEYLNTVFIEKEVWFWNGWDIRYQKHFKNNKIHGSCFIGRVFMYKNINQSKYIEHFSQLIKNKRNIVVCNKTIMVKHINNFYFQSENNIYLLCKEEATFNNENIKNDVNEIINNITKYYNIEKCNIMLHYGLMSKDICLNLLNNYNITSFDLGYFNFNNISFKKSYYYNINNVLSILNNYIFSNNDIKYSIKTNHEILDEKEPLYINITEILDETSNTMKIFGVRFNQESLSCNYLKSIIKGKLKVKSNLPLKIFNGKSWLHININSYENDFEIHNINKWRISPSNEYLSENIGSKNVNFIIYHVEFKIDEIVV
jgi:hypothetical protein